MHCPHCGCLMEIHRPPKPPPIDWSLPTEELDKQIELAQAMEKVKRYELTCPDGCFQKDFPLYYHNPFAGINSEPTDNWSISWVK